MPTCSQNLQFLKFTGSWLWISRKADFIRVFQSSLRWHFPLPALEAFVNITVSISNSNTSRSMVSWHFNIKWSMGWYGLLQKPSALEDTGARGGMLRISWWEQVSQSLQKSVITRSHILHSFSLLMESQQCSDRRARMHGGVPAPWPWEPTIWLTLTWGALPVLAFRLARTWDVMLSGRSLRGYFWSRFFLLPKSHVGRNSCHCHFFYWVLW